MMIPAHNRRVALRALAVATGGLLLARAAAPFVTAQDDNDDDSGRGRGRGRGGDNRGSDEIVIPSGSVPPGSVEIRIVSDDPGGFVPAEVTVDAGQAIAFVNLHHDPHTATGSGFDTGIIQSGAVATVVMETPGVFAYACQIHPEMTGQVNVRGADGTVPVATPAAAPAGAAEVRIANLAFAPAELSVSRGETVVWTNDDAVPHTVTALDGSFGSGIFDPGASFSWTFPDAGTFAYQCLLHPQMQATVIVGDGPAAVAASAATPAAAPDAVAVPAPSVWMLSLTPDNSTTLPGLAVVLTLHADGTAQATSVATGEAPSGSFTEGSGQGQWNAAQDRIGIVLLLLGTTPDGQFVGTSTTAIDAIVSSDGNVDGSFSIDLASPSGEPMTTGAGSVTGSRMVIEPVLTD